METDQSPVKVILCCVVRVDGTREETRKCIESQTWHFNILETFKMKIGYNNIHKNRCSGLEIIRGISNCIIEDLTQFFTIIMYNVFFTRVKILR